MEEWDPSCYPSQEADKSQTDEESLSRLSEAEGKSPFGKIFGSRGRGFSLLKSCPGPRTNIRPLRSGTTSLQKLRIAAEAQFGGPSQEAQPQTQLDTQPQRQYDTQPQRQYDTQPQRQLDTQPELEQAQSLEYLGIPSGSEEWTSSRSFGTYPEQPRKPRSTYIPKEPTDDEDELFGNTISSGINFNKYDDIEVRVSGENPPPPIRTFEEAGLRNHIIDVIKKCNYKKPTPIQKYSIPIIMNGRDMMACAQTGSGKTAAFLIPIVNTLLEQQVPMHFGSVCKPQVIVISPTRELTIQIFNEARKFSKGTVIKVAISYGGTAVSYQIQNILKGCHILVATPGRLLDFVGRGKIELSEVKFLVLDEADRMLDLGFIGDIQTLLSHRTMVDSGERTTLMFSATFPEEIQQLASQFLHNYIFVAVGVVGGACADVEQRFFCVSKFEKRNKLVELMTERGGSKCLVFVEQKRTTDFIATVLSEKNFPATSIHGDREQREREEALNDFKSGRMDILVATSVAARGLDIKNVAHVVNYDLPKTIDEYVHRIGRTGRVGNRGLATSFYDPDQDRSLAGDLVKILMQAGQPVPDFLRNAGFGASGFTGSRFGGRDYRNRGFGHTLGTASESTYEEEVWN